MKHTSAIAFAQPGLPAARLLAPERHRYARAWICSYAMKMQSLIEPHFDAAALLTIDVQADTLDGAVLEIPGTSTAVPRIVSLCQAFRNAGLPIVHIVRLYLADLSVTG